MASTSLSMSLIWASLRMDCFSTNSLNCGMGSLACSKMADFGLDRQVQNLEAFPCNIGHITYLHLLCNSLPYFM